MEKLLLLCGLVLSSHGCSTSSSGGAPTPSGKVMQEVKCSISANSCFKKANAICKGSYQAIDSSSNSGGIIADVMSGPVTWCRMSFLCGKSDGRMPSFPFRGQPYNPPPIVTTQSKTTTCNTYGNSVTCNSD